MSLSPKLLVFIKCFWNAFSVYFDKTVIWYTSEILCVKNTKVLLQTIFIIYTNSKKFRFHKRLKVTINFSNVYIFIYFRLDNVESVVDTKFNLSHHDLKSCSNNFGHEKLFWHTAMRRLEPDESKLFTTKVKKKTDKVSVSVRSMERLTPRWSRSNERRKNRRVTLCYFPCYCFCLCCSFVAPRNNVRVSSRSLHALFLISSVHVCVCVCVLFVFLRDERAFKLDGWNERAIHGR